MDPQNDEMDGIDLLAVCEACGRCAWCMAERGVPWPSGVSSRICERHLAQERARTHQRRAPLTITRRYQPDVERQVQALEAVLRDAPSAPHGGPARRPARRPRWLISL